MLSESLEEICSREENAGLSQPTPPHLPTRVLTLDSPSPVSSLLFISTTVLSSHTSPTGDLACSPDMCPDWESNWQPLVHRRSLNPLRLNSQGAKAIVKQAPHPSKVIHNITRTPSLIASPATLLLRATPLDRAVPVSLFCQVHSRLWALCLKLPLPLLPSSGSQQGCPPLFFFIILSFTQLPPPRRGFP